MSDDKLKKMISDRRQGAAAVQETLPGSLDEDLVMSDDKLKKMISESSLPVQFPALRRLARINGPACVEFLAAVVGDENIDVESRIDAATIILKVAIADA